MLQLIAQVQDAISIFEFLHGDNIAVFIFDCSSAHEAFASDALLAHKMNRSPGGAQREMHDTIKTATNAAQQMVYPDECEDFDKDRKPLAGLSKGMEQVLSEWQLLGTLETKNVRYVKVCAECKKSQVAQDKAVKEAKAREDEIDGSGIKGLADRGVSETEIDDLA